MQAPGGLEVKLEWLLGGMQTTDVIRQEQSELGELWALQKKIFTVMPTPSYTETDASSSLSKIMKHVIKAAHYPGALYNTLQMPYKLCILDIDVVVTCCCGRRCHVTEGCAM